MIGVLRAGVSTGADCNTEGKKTLPAPSVPNVAFLMKVRLVSVEEVFITLFMAFLLVEIYNEIKGIVSCP
jgi:hypothetical protein